MIAAAGMAGRRRTVRTSVAVGTAPRQLFQDVESTRPRGIRSQQRNSAAASFYGSRVRPEASYASLQDEQDDLEQQNGAAYWQPGQTIPTASTSIDSYDLDFSDAGQCQEKLWHDIKSFVTGEFLKLEERMTQRIECLEDDISSLTKRIDDFQSSATMSSPAGSTPSGRRRKSPLSLQMRIRGVHKALRDENQLHVDEPIDSVHNKKVVESISDEIAGFPKDKIRAGVNTYRKSLKREQKEEEAEKRARRSRQQRLWERRSKHVTSNSEKEKWEFVKANMMSDEENLPDGKLARKRPCWRSDELNALVDTLDARADAALKTARKPRVLSSPWKIAPPPDCEDWMKNMELNV